MKSCNLQPFFKKKKKSNRNARLKHIFILLISHNKYKNFVICFIYYNRITLVVNSKYIIIENIKQLFVIVLTFGIQLHDIVPLIMIF